MNLITIALLLLSLHLSFFTTTTRATTPWFDLHTYSFDSYAKEFSKDYSNDDPILRKQIFDSKLEDIKKHNADPTKTWKKGVNRFTDRTETEFRRLLGTKKGLLYQHKSSDKESVAVASSHHVKYDPKAAAIPEQMDWREKGVITSVKDQGECGSCWTFATTETTESYWALATGKLHVLSEQQILDCTPNPQQCGGTGGCGGGTAELAWAKIIEMGGLETEWTYPYQSYFGASFQCHYSKATPVAHISKFVNLPSNEQDPMLNYVGTTGPLAISVDASAWDSYESGVFDGCNQTNPDINHAVQLVGYGTDATLGDYWLVRNSWSPSWGEVGYIRLKRSTSFTCGIDLTPGDGDGCTGGPPTVKVCGTCGILYDGVYPVGST